jgi:hypothetical protein
VATLLLRGAKHLPDPGKYPPDQLPEPAPSPAPPAPPPTALNHRLQSTVSLMELPLLGVLRAPRLHFPRPHRYKIRAACHCPRTEAGSVSASPCSPWALPQKNSMHPPAAKTLTVSAQQSPPKRSHPSPHRPNQLRPLAAFNADFYPQSRLVLAQSRSRRRCATFTAILPRGSHGISTSTPRRQDAIPLKCDTTMAALHESRPMRSPQCELSPGEYECGWRG